ncbi:hypothetical protein MIND_00508400 [Mycena indigotica]|uniref:Uncharacterized protein n=1 Tax=Mycena indigotica TaxID=2126181 RepID=A0A8H6T0C6_9AGAR|nr:uncharacterized protein MIND_00508400 [Mycena indigotica]KAF7307150.1 hypothetical protein MIND_00508400 [Mycena indigotica]
MADDFATAEHFIYVTQVYFCAMYAVVVWDWLISLPREVNVPVLPLLGYLCRPFPVVSVSSLPATSKHLMSFTPDCFVLDHSREFCEKLFRAPVAIALWNQVGAEAVLLIRTYAFFNRNIYILWFLVSALSGVVAYQLYVASDQMLLLPFFKPPFDQGPCFPMSKPHSAHLLGFFIAPLAFDTIVTGMTVIKAFTIRRRNGGPNSRLIQTFLREGVFYYILISIANLINGIFYMQPRQVLSALNIPLSVQLSPLLAAKLILDLRERGSETVSHSEGTGIAAFTTKSVTQQSPFTPPHHRNKSALYSRNTRHTDSNIVLSTLGSVLPEHDADISDMDNLHQIGIMDLGSLSTAIGGDDGEPIEKDDGTPAPAYSHSLEMGFRAASRSPSLDSDIRGIRVTVDVEKATSSI